VSTPKTTRNVDAFLAEERAWYAVAKTPWTPELEAALRATREGRVAELHDNLADLWEALPYKRSLGWTVKGLERFIGWLYR
jgi:hypothetical protein